MLGYATLAASIGMALDTLYVLRSTLSQNVTIDQIPADSNT